MTLEGEAAPSPERLMQAGVTVALQMGSRRTQIIGRSPDMPMGGEGLVRLTEAPLDRLANRNRLSSDPEQNRQLYEAGCKLRDHHYLAGLSGFPANDLNGGGGGHPSSRTPITETMEKNRRSLRLAQTAMDRGDWGVVVDVVCEELTLQAAGRKVGYGNDEAAAAVALDRVRRGLAILADLWGYSPPQRPRSNDADAANDGGPGQRAA